MLVDTGSNWLWVNSKYCNNCVEAKTKGFDHLTSSTFDAIKKPFVLHYGSGSVAGLPAFDQVCLVSRSRDSCTSSEMEFMVVLRQSGLDFLKVQGLIGMTPTRMEKEADLFIEELYAAGVVDSQVFSIYI